MKKAILFVATVTFLPLVGVAAPTKGIDGLNLYNCTVLSVSGEIEQLVPIESYMLAQSSEQATALYINKIGADVTIEKRLFISYKDKSSQVKNDAFKEISCKLVTIQ